LPNYFKLLSTAQLSRGRRGKRTYNVPSNVPVRLWFLNSERPALGVSDCLVTGEEGAQNILEKLYTKIQSIITPKLSTFVRNLINIYWQKIMLFYLFIGFKKEKLEKLFFIHRHTELRRRGVKEMFAKLRGH
jgi:hypothetical protein